jgi:hypothetical protein
MDTDPPNFVGRPSRTAEEFTAKQVYISQRLRDENLERSSLPANTSKRQLVIWGVSTLLLSILFILITTGSVSSGHRSSLRDFTGTRDRTCPCCRASSHIWTILLSIYDRRVVASTVLAYFGQPRNCFVSQRQKIQSCALGRLFRSLCPWHREHGCCTKHSFTRSDATFDDICSDVIHLACDWIMLPWTNWICQLDPFDIRKRQKLAHFLTRPGCIISSSTTH